MLILAFLVLFWKIFPHRPYDHFATYISPFLVIHLIYLHSNGLELEIETKN